MAILRAKASKFCTSTRSGLLDPLFHFGKYEPKGEYLCVRAVLPETDTTEGGIYTGHVEDDIRSALLFQIEAVGPKAKEYAGNVGDFALSLATSLNPVNGANASRFGLVHKDTVAAVIKADGLEQLFDYMAEQEAQVRAKANGLE
jgi:hypothetical protein